MPLLNWLLILIGPWLVVAAVPVMAELPDLIALLLRPIARPRPRPVTRPRPRLVVAW